MKERERGSVSHDAGGARRIRIADLPVEQGPKAGTRRAELDHVGHYSFCVEIQGVQAG